MKPIGQEMWSQSPPGTSLFMSSGKFGELFSSLWLWYSCEQNVEFKDGWYCWIPQNGGEHEILIIQEDMNTCTITV